MRAVLRPRPLSAFSGRPRADLGTHSPDPAPATHSEGHDQEAPPISEDDIRLSATMYFRYGSKKRPGVKSETTFDAILAGERTSTTRFAGWSSSTRWAHIQPGDLVRFYEDKAMRGRSLVVRVREISDIDLRSCDAETLEAWSRAEGWKPEEGRAIAQRNGVALWVRYDLVEPRPSLKRTDVAESVSPEEEQLTLRL